MEGEEARYVAAEKAKWSNIVAWKHFFSKLAANTDALVKAEHVDGSKKESTSKIVFRTTEN